MKFVLIDGRMCLQTSSRMERSWQAHRWYRGARNTAYLRSIGADCYDFSRYEASSRAGRITEVRRAKRSHKHTTVAAQISQGIEDYWDDVWAEKDSDFEFEEERKHWAWYLGEGGVYDLEDAKWRAELDELYHYEQDIDDDYYPEWDWY